MPVSVRVRALVAQSQSEESAVSWPSMRLLGLMSDKHFAQAVAVIEADHDGGHLSCAACDVLHEIDETLRQIMSEESPA